MGYYQWKEVTPFAHWAQLKHYFGQQDKYSGWLNCVASKSFIHSIKSQGHNEEVCELTEVNLWVSQFLNMSMDFKKRSIELQKTFFLWNLTYSDSWILNLTAVSLLKLEIGCR